MVTANQDKKVAINARGIPEQLRYRWKVFCTSRGMNMTEGIAALIEDHLKKFDPSSRDLDKSCQS